MANHLANYVRSLVLPKQVEHWSLTYRPRKLVKIRANAFANGHCVTFLVAMGALHLDLCWHTLGWLDRMALSSQAACERA